MNAFWGYLGGSIIKPRYTFTRLSVDPNGLLQGTRATIFIGILYTLTVIGLAMSGAEVSAAPWLVISSERYYFWEIFFAMPVFLLGWILVSGLIQLISHGLHGRGTFEHTLAATGFALTIPSFVTWIPETVGAILFLTGTVSQEALMEAIARPGFWQMFATLYQFVAIGWMLLLIPLAIAVVQKIRLWQAAILGTVSLGVFMTIMLVFIR